MKRTRAKLALLAAVPLAAAFAAVGTTTAASARTAPGGTYAIQSSQTKVVIYISSNSSHYNIRAKAVCLSGTFYGGWHTSGSSTAVCGGGTKLAGAYTQYDETHKYQIAVWFPGDSLTGFW